MDKKIITTKQDLTYLKWSHYRSSSGTAGTFLKSEETVNGKKLYYKLSNYDSEKGIIGHECINEIIVDRMLTLLNVPHLEYTLIHADVSIDGRLYATWLCSSFDFKENGESKSALDNYYEINHIHNESRYDFCVRNGWKDYIDTMLVIDYLILNRDRHGANIEVLKNARNKTLRIAPLFDHGLSFLCSCFSDSEIENFDISADRPCNNYIGSRSVLENLKYTNNKYMFSNKLSLSDKKYLFHDLDDALSDAHKEKIWNMIWSRWCYYENICNL